jgi:hypothetical protein
MTERQQLDKHKPDDFDLALIALRRAADTACKRARMRDGKLVVWRDGQMVNEPVTDPKSPQDRSD